MAATSTSTPDCLALGLTATGIAIARAVRPAAATVIGLDSDRSSPGRAAPDVTMIAGLSELALGDGLAAAIARHARRRGVPPVLMPANDAAVRWLIDHRRHLADHARLPVAMEPGRAGRLVDKRSLAALCSEAGIAIPRTLAVDLADPEAGQQIDAFVAGAGLPCLLKPRRPDRFRRRLRGAKLVVAADRAGLDRRLREVFAGGRDAVLQERIPGPESNILVALCRCAESGGLRHVFTGRKLRQLPLDHGSATSVRAEHLPELSARVAEIAESLDLRGLSGLEFKRDPRDGRLVLLEINPRPVLWADLARASGCHLLRAWYADLAGLPPIPIRAQRQGTTWRYLSRDLAAITLRHRTPRAIAAALATTPASDCWATLEARRPATISASVRHTAAQVFSYLRAPT